MRGTESSRWQHCVLNPALVLIIKPHLSLKPVLDSQAFTLNCCQIYRTPAVSPADGGPVLFYWTVVR